MSDLVVNVRQVSSYPQQGVLPTDNILLQRGGLGGPYVSASAQTLVQSALINGSMGVGMGVPAGADAGQVFADQFVVPLEGDLFWNAYQTAPAGASYLTSGLAGQLAFWPLGFAFNVAPIGSAGAPVVGWTNLLTLSPAGAMSLPLGTLTVARDPAAALEVATLNYVSNNTVASFNGRRGAVQLSPQDILTALSADSPIATQNWVNGAITAGLQGMLYTCPFVNRWNGRTGSVNLMLSDITCVFFQSGQIPITPTPPTTSDDYSIANTAWVVAYVTSEFAGAGSLATQAWVLANTVNSFNGRMGLVSLTLADITGAGGAPLNSPQLSGVPTAPTQNVGNASSAIATTAFVWQAVQESTTGVISWNGRTGTVTLDAQDIYDAGGALLNGPVFTGVPQAPTAAPGTATNQLATTSFVMQEIAATTAGVASFNTRTGAVTLTMADVTGAGGAPIASPAFTGTPTTPTPLNPLQGNADIPNTNWVVAYVGLSTVTSFNTRTGAVQLNANDVTAAGGLANPSPIMTGQPTAPTAIPGTNTTQLATCAFVQAAIQNLAGIIVSSTPPASPLQGTGWFDMTKAQLFVWTGTTWVIAVNPPTVNTANFAQLSGATFTGPVVLSGNAPSNAPLQAVPLQQLQTYLPLAGGTLTGTLTIAGANSAGLNIIPTSGQAQIGLNKPASGNTSGIIGLTNGNFRWMIQLGNQAAESGSNVGSDFEIDGYTDTGTLIGPAMSFGRASMQATFNYNVNFLTSFTCPQVTAGTFHNANSMNYAPTTGMVIENTNNAMLSLNKIGGNGVVAQFLQGATACGSITVANATSTAFNTSSDERQKQDAQAFDAGPILDATVVYNFEWISAPGVRAYGVMAQEADLVFPDAVHHDTTNDTWGVDYSKYVPLLLQEVKTLRARVAALEARP